MWLTWGIPLLIPLITFAAFLPALGNGFVAWDDQANFLENPHYRGLGLSNLRWMWSTFLLGHYVPLSWMTLGFDYVLWGMNPAGYHLTSMLVHSVNALLVYFLARRILAGRDARTVGMAAAFAALLFAVHPLRVESVAWATERRDVLSAFFCLATLLCYLRFTGAGRRGYAWYGAALIAYACALLSKGTSVTLPAVLLVMNVYPLRRLTSDWRSPSTRRVIGELAPFAFLAAAFVVLTFVALQAMPQLTVGRKVAVSAFSLVFYMWKTLAPTGLVPLYDMPPEIDPAAPIYLLCYAVVIALSVAAWRLRKTRPGFTTAWILFVLILFPLLGVHQNGPQIAADRYTYNAAPVAAILVAAGWLAVLERTPAIALSVGAAVVMLLGVLTWKQNLIWRDSRTMWTAVLQRNDRSSIALTALGNLAARDGQNDSAISYYQRSLAIDAASGEAENNLGIALSQAGRMGEARAHFERATRLKPDYYEAENNLGLAIAELGGDPEIAIGHYRSALRFNPGYADAHVNWGNALVMQGRFAEAIPHYVQAVAIRPDNADAHRNWGVALARQDKLDEAIAHFRRATELRPGFTDAERLLGQALALQRGRGGVKNR